MAGVAAAAASEDTVVACDTAAASEDTVAACDTAAASYAVAVAVASCTIEA